MTAMKNGDGFAGCVCLHFNLTSDSNILHTAAILREQHVALAADMPWHSVYLKCRTGQRKSVNVCA